MCFIGNNNSDSGEEPDTLFDVFESILSGLFVVLDEGQLPEEIQEFITNSQDIVRSPTSKQTEVSAARVGV